MNININEQELAERTSYLFSDQQQQQQQQQQDSMTQSSLGEQFPGHFNS